MGRFLEHTRVYYFQNNDNAKLYCSSADWMGRNLFSRVETCFPSEAPKLRKQIIEDGLLNYLKDNVRAWELAANGQWIALQTAEHETPFIAHQYLMEQRVIKTIA